MKTDAATLNTDTPLTSSTTSLPDSTRGILWLGSAAFIVLILSALFALVLVGKEIQAGRESSAELSRTHDVLQDLQLLLGTLADAETSERGYVITGEGEFLEPYHQARAMLPEALERLSANVHDAEMKTLLDDFASRSQRFMIFLDGVINIRRTQGSQPAEALIATGQGKVQMDELRTLAARMQARERRLLEQRQDDAQRRSNRAEGALTAALIGSIAFMLIAGLMLVRHMRARTAAEREAEAAVGVLRSTLDSVHQGVLVLDQAKRIVAWNERFVQLRGLGQAKLFRGMPVAELSRKAEALTAPVNSGTTSTEPLLHFVLEDRDFDLERARRNGTVLQVQGRAMKDGRYIVTYTDVTALKHSELAYRDQATRLSATLDNIVDAIITINESGSIESWSQGAQRLFGYTSDEVLHRNVSVLMADSRGAANDRYLRYFMTAGETGVRRELEGVHKDGHRLPIELGVSEMHIGKRRLFIGVIRDISDRREIERLKAGFVSTVSHELRTPLTSISGSLGLIAGGVAGELTPKAKRLIDIAKVNCERLVRLINDILDLEKAESGKLEFQLETQPLRPIVEHVVETMRGFGDQYRVRVELLPTKADPTVFVDRDRLVQVLTNLVSNACKFSPAGTAVELAIRADGDSAEVLVRDHGPGIPREFRPRMFQRFAQADSSDSRAKGGTGLGLSIAKTITERLGGSISFDTEEGQGTTFYVSLPLRQAPAETKAPPQEEHRGASVLIVEDDPDVATVLSQMLRKEGMRADSVGTARGAKQTLLGMHYDLALIDLHLPDMEGLDLIAELRAEPATRSLPLIVITAGQVVGSEAESLKALHLADWLQKPIDPQRLLRSIQQSMTVRNDARPQVLHIEDDVPLTMLVKELLSDEADVMAAHSIAEAQKYITGGRVFDLIILDVTLADGSGLEVLPSLANEDVKPPVILYSATEPSRDISQLVEGALVKSRDSVDQLLARVRALAQTKRGPEAQAGAGRSSG